jgi:hypothetical protein
MLTLAVTTRADRVIYRGEAPGTSGIRLTGWGSGQAVDTATEGYGGSRSLRVSVDGFYSGGRIIFTTPVDLTADVTNPNAYLEFVIKFQQGQIRALASRAGIYPGQEGGAYGGAGVGPAGAPGALGSGPAGFPGVSDAFPGGEFGPAGFPGSGFPGSGFPGAGPGTQGQPVVPDTRRLRVVLVFDGAQAVSYDHPLVMFPTPNPAWVRVAIPFAKFKSTARLSRYMLRELRIFGDSPDVFNIGEIRTVTDTDPIIIEPIDEQVVSVNDLVTFSARAEAGLSLLKYSWDFDASDGIQEDAVGPRVTTVYRKAPKANAYKVTLTVTDMAGVKKTEKVVTLIEVID